MQLVTNTQVPHYGNLQKLSPKKKIVRRTTFGRFRFRLSMRCKRRNQYHECHGTQFSHARQTSRQRLRMLWQAVFLCVADTATLVTRIVAQPLCSLDPPFLLACFSRRELHPRDHLELCTFQKMLRDKATLNLSGCSLGQVVCNEETLRHLEVSQFRLRMSQDLRSFCFLS